MEVLFFFILICVGAYIMGRYFNGNESSNSSLRNKALRNETFDPRQVDKIVNRQMPKFGLKVEDLKFKELSTKAVKVQGIPPIPHEIDLLISTKLWDVTDGLKKPVALLNNVHFFRQGTYKSFPILSWGPKRCLGILSSAMLIL